MQLSGVRALLDVLPPVPKPCTVGGTKGKGSTLRLIECALVAANEPTLAFTSPHVCSVLERWRIDGVPANPDIIAACCTAVALLEEKHHLILTYFERTFAIACLLASRRPGTRFLLEVGLGGRLDCANALDCAVAIITHLSLDHCDILGPTLQHIAHEKLAISRRDAPLVIAPQSAQGTLAIWRQLAKYRIVTNNSKRTTHINLLPKPLTAWVPRPSQHMVVGLNGEHQQDNAATAAMALLLWLPHLDQSAMRRGFANATLAARCQIIKQDQRTILIDGAHNKDSIMATLAVAAKTFKSAWRLVFGIAHDKDIAAILTIIPAHVHVVRVGYHSPRARQQHDWPKSAQAWPWYDNIEAALAAQPTDVDLCITGSFYLAGEALQVIAPEHGIPG